MHIEYTPDQQALRQEFRTYLEGVMTPEVREKTRARESGEAYRTVIRQSRARSHGSEDCA